MSFARSRPLAALAVIGAAAAIAGCGGGDDSGGLSADEFRTQADAICADADSRIEALDEPSANDQILGFLQSGLTIQREQIEKLKALEAPSDLSGTFGEATGLLDQQLSEIQGAADRIAGGEDPQAVVTELGPKIDDLSEQADAKAKELGLTVCGDDEDGGTGTTATTATAPTATAPAPATDTTASGPAGDTGTYVEDVQEAAGALTEFGTALQSTTSLDDLKAKVPDATAALDTFDTAISDLGAYTLEDATLEQQRAGLVRTGPKVSDVLRRFLDAAQEGDVSAVQALVPEVTSTITEFQQAATGG
jgi:hypothetical protein